MIEELKSNSVQTWFADFLEALGRARSPTARQSSPPTSPIATQLATRSVTKIH